MEKVINKTYYRALIWGIMVSIVVSFSMYVFLVQKAVVNVVEREKTERHIADLTTKIGELEFSYISKRNDITIDRAYALGYQDIAEAKYVSRKTYVSSIVGAQF